MWQFLPACGIRVARSLAGLAPEQTSYEGAAMNWDQIEGNWKRVKGKAKEKWADLSADDLTALSVKKDQLAGKLQERYGYAKEQAERELDEFARTLDTP